MVAMKLSFGIAASVPAVLYASLRRAQPVDLPLTVDQPLPNIDGSDTSDTALTQRGNKTSRDEDCFGEVLNLLEAKSEAEPHLPMSDSMHEVVKDLIGSAEPCKGADPDDMARQILDKRIRHIRQHIKEHVQENTLAVTKENLVKLELPDEIKQAINEASDVESLTIILVHLQSELTTVAKSFGWETPN